MALDIQKVSVGNVLCENASIQYSNGIYSCTLTENLCAGYHEVIIIVKDYGRAKIEMAANQNIFIKPEFSNNFNENPPPSFSKTGGAILKFSSADNNFCSGSLNYAYVQDEDTGENFGRVQEVSFLNSAAEDSSSQVQEIELQLPVINKINSNLHIVFADDLKFKFTFCTAPVISNIDNSLSMDAGQGFLTLQGTFPNQPKASFIKLDENTMTIISWTDDTIVLSSSIDLLPSKSYLLGIFFDGVCKGFPDNYPPTPISINLFYSNFYPTNPSVLGGQIFEIHGKGFTSKLESIKIKDDSNSVCKILTASNEKITCQMPKSTKSFYKITTEGSQNYDGQVVPNFKDPPPI